jgi:uncharacterized protein
MRSRLYLLLLLVLLGGCTATSAAPSAVPARDAATVPVVVRGPDGEQLTFTAEVAADRASRRRGLQHRTSLPADAGMLFVFPRDTRRGFWMKDTLVPLTIAFARADGTIVTVRDMEPCTAWRCPSYRPDGAYRMALEVNQGALGEAGPGWTLAVGAGPPDGEG